MSWTAIFILAGGAYAFKALGLVVLGPLSNRRSGADTRTAAGTVAGGGGRTAPGLSVAIGQLRPPALLAALVVSQTVVTGTDLVVDARLAGVAAGAVSVWRGAPFWLVLVIAAAVAAGLRQVT